MQIDRFTASTQDNHRSSSKAHTCATSRIVIRRIVANQVVSILSVSSAHPHFGADEFRGRHPEQFEDFPGVSTGQPRRTPGRNTDAGGRLAECDGHGQAIVDGSEDVPAPATSREYDESQGVAA